MPRGSTPRRPERSRIHGRKGQGVGEGAPCVTGQSPVWEEGHVLHGRRGRLGVNALDPLELCAEPRLGGYLVGHVHFTAVENQSLCSLEGRLRALGSYSPLRVKWEIPPLP